MHRFKFDLNKFQTRVDQEAQVLKNFEEEIKEFQQRIERQKHYLLIYGEENSKFDKLLQEIKQRSNDYAETPKMTFKGWCWETIQGRNFVNDPDNSSKFSTQNSKLIEWFTKFDDNKFRNLKENNDRADNQKYDKKMTAIKSSDQFYLLYFINSKKTIFEVIRKWTAVEKRSIIINLFGDKYSIEARVHHRIELLLKITYI
jgi:hypothetical protein